MTVIRTIHNKENPYAQLSKSVINDPNLSFKALGLWTWAMSKPNNWHFHVDHIAKTRKEGKDALMSTIKELIKEGYCIRFQNKQKTAQGKMIFDSVEYLFFEYKPTLEEVEELKKSFPQRAFPLPENPQLVNTEIPMESIKEKQQQPAAASLEKQENNNSHLALIELKISEVDRTWIATHYDEATIKHAILWASKSKIKTTPAQAIKWACANNPEIPESCQDREKKNKDIAKQLLAQAKTPADIIFSVCNKYAEIGHINASQRTYINYSENGFEEQLINCLRKHGIKKKTK